MCYTLIDIFNQAQADEFSAVLDGDDFEARILSGIRIEQEKETKKTIIHNTTRGGDFYREITSEQYEMFYEKGWTVGVYVLSLSNYRRKLEMIESNIKREVNTRKNAKHIMHLKSARERIMNSYSKVNKKLNKIIKQQTNDN
tara:strand:+ start:1870 stop:2295 length:426 start_codon:yes stop_codon:yes gene_type:complete